MSEDIETIRDAYESLKRLHLLSNETNERLLDENKKLKLELDFIRQLNSNADKNVEIQKMITVNSLQSSQEKHERDYQEILELKNEIKQLKSKIG